MTNRLLLPLLALLLLTLAPPAVSARTTSQFQKWYKQYQYTFETILHTNCTTEYQHYLTGHPPPSFQIDHLGGGAKASALTQPVIQCILGLTGEYVKSQLASAQVLLGVAPTILAILGPRTDEMSTLLLISRRPFLFLILACGSPSIYFSRAFEYMSPKNMLASRDYVQPNLNSLVQRATTSSSDTRAKIVFVTVLQYVVSIAAVANIAWLNYELGVRTICIIWSGSTFAPMAWGAAGIFNHILGAITLRTRIRRLDEDEEATGVNNQGLVAGGKWSVKRVVRNWMSHEFRISSTQRGVRLDEFPDSYAYVVLSWLSSTCIIAHVLFGTILYSGTLFIGPEDTLSVVVRYMVSVMVCRMVLMYELSGLREAYLASNPSPEGSVVRGPVGGGSGGESGEYLGPKKRVAYAEEEMIMTGR